MLQALLCHLVYFVSLYLSISTFIISDFPVLPLCTLLSFGVIPRAMPFVLFWFFCALVIIPTSSSGLYLVALFVKCVALLRLRLFFVLCWLMAELLIHVCLCELWDQVITSLVMEQYSVDISATLFIGAPLAYIVETHALNRPSTRKYSQDWLGCHVRVKSHVRCSIMTTSSDVAPSGRSGWSEGLAIFWRGEKRLMLPARRREPAEVEIEEKIKKKKKVRG